MNTRRRRLAQKAVDSVPRPLPPDELLELSVEEQRRILREWAERGPQGPLDADDARPDES